MPLAALGLVVTWGGYWFLSYGLALRKNANVTLLKMASPAQRPAVVAAMAQAWNVTP